MRRSLSTVLGVGSLVVALIGAGEAFTSSVAAAPSLMR
jgi:hypothetical protein